MQISSHWEKINFKFSDFLLPLKNNVPGTNGLIVCIGQKPGAI
jgi:hypothetical protein